jgi:hypothetical protein
MSFAKNYLKQYNADSAWNSLGAVGTTSAWEGGNNPLNAYREIQSTLRNISSPRRSGGGTPYAAEAPARYGTFGRDALNTSFFLANLTPETMQENLNTYQQGVLAGRYFDPLRTRNIFTGF